MAARLRAANEVAAVESITGVTTRWGVRLRFALNAPHKPRRRASLWRPPQRQQQVKRKRDTSNEVRKGTFLKRFDRHRESVGMGERTVLASAAGRTLRRTPRKG